MQSVLLLLAVSLSISKVLSIGGGFQHPVGCEKSECEIYATWARSGDGDEDDKLVDFYLEAKSDGWAAIGLSADKLMGTLGIDDVLACQRDEKDDAIVYAKDMYNPEDQSVNRNNQCNNNQYAIHLQNSSFTDGRIKCSFSRLIITNNTQQDRHLNESYYIFLAYGSERGTPTSALEIHDSKYISGNKLDVATSGSAVEGCSVSWLTRIHGVLMFIAYAVLLPIGIFIAAHMKVALSAHGMWFQVHRVVMILSALFAIVGFILIFVANKDTHGLIVLGSENKLGTAHFSIGIFVIFLHILNPVIALFRCKPDSRFRPIFNVIHKFAIGYVLNTFGSINITLGLFAFVALAGDQVPYVLFAWGVLSIGYFIFIDVGAYLYFRVISPRCKKADSIETQQLIANEKGSAPEPQTCVWVVFIAVLVALFGLGGIIAALILIGCI